MAMAKLGDDLRNILVNVTLKSTLKSLDGVNSHVQENYDEVRSEYEDELALDLAKLKEIADCMIRCGYENDCCVIYSSVRSHVLYECMVILGTEKCSIEEVEKMEWTTLCVHMGKWIHAFKMLVKLLSSERFLCEEVFAGSEPVREVCFVESAKGCAMQMLNFGRVAIYGMFSEEGFRAFDRFDEVELCKWSSEKLFRILDMYDALSDVMPDLEALFDGDGGAGEVVWIEARGVLEVLCEAAIGTFAEFERAVHEQTPGLRMLPNGDIHPLTRYVMDSVKLLVDYSEILNGVLEKTSQYNQEQLQKDEAENVERMPRITWRLLSLINSLESNLKEKSRMYEDGGLQHVFLMNNVLYMVDKLKDPEVRNLLGHQCISKRRDQIRQYALSYLRASWTKTSNCLHIERFSDKALKGRVKVKLKKFNAYFEDTYRIQTAWKVADSQLRLELCLLISENLVTLYRSFLKRYSLLVRVNIRYSLDDLLSHVLELFEGTSCIMQTTEKKTVPLLIKGWLCS